MNWNRNFLIILCFACWAITCCNNSSDKSNTTSDDSLISGTDILNTESKTIISYFSKAKQFSTYNSLLSMFKLPETLDQPGPFTVFAPSNEAFDKLPHGLLIQLQTSDRDSLRDMLTSQIVAGALQPEELQKMKKLKTLSGSELTVSAAGQQLFINRKKISEVGITCSNGIIYLVNDLFNNSSPQ